jgi:hypothetical protein
MNAQQIATLSQIQAQAIVNARKAATANLTPAQISTQIQLQVSLCCCDSFDKGQYLVLPQIFNRRWG